MWTFATAAGIDLATEHLVLLIVAVLSTGIVLLIILLIALFWGTRKNRGRRRKPELPTITEPNQSPLGSGQNPFGGPD
jgi:hypothetical protein